MSFYTNNARVNPVDAVDDFLTILALIGLLFLCGQIIGVFFFDKNLLIIESYIEARSVYQDFTYKCIIFLCESLFTTILPFFSIYVARKSKHASFPFSLFVFALFFMIFTYQIIIARNIDPIILLM